MNLLNDFDKDKAALQEELAKRKKNASKKLRSLEFSHTECLKWPELYHEGILLQANLYRWNEEDRSVIVSDWNNENQMRTITLSKPFNRQKEIAQRFQASKRQRLALPRIESEIAKAKATFDDLQASSEELMSIVEANDLIAFKNLFLKKPTIQSSTSKKLAKALPYREYVSSAGLQIWVGRKAKDNETLTFKLANGSDYWLHAHGYPGSHVIIKCPKGNEPDSVTLQEALQLAVYFSKAKDQGRVEVLVTQRKYVSPYGKGSKNPGKVQVSKHKLISVKPDPGCLEKLM
ncbi:MAG: DUF814 domain-containing protein [Parachlamydiaceae bacterium]|nr:DUF814 domain-containing protein [Parachlamydiaceae bacterium]